jgi:hypothetical protein
VLDLQIALEDKDEQLRELQEEMRRLKAAVLSPRQELARLTEEAARKKRGKRNKKSPPVVQKLIIEEIVCVPRPTESVLEVDPVPPAPPAIEHAPARRKDDDPRDGSPAIEEHVVLVPPPLPIDPVPPAPPAIEHAPARRKDDDPRDDPPAIEEHVVLVPPPLPIRESQVCVTELSPQDEQDEFGITDDANIKERTYQKWLAETKKKSEQFWSQDTAYVNQLKRMVFSSRSTEETEEEEEENFVCPLEHDNNNKLEDTYKWEGDPRYARKGERFHGKSCWECSRTFSNAKIRETDVVPSQGEPLYRCCNNIRGCSMILCFACYTVRLNAQDTTSRVRKTRAKRLSKRPNH